MIIGISTRPCQVPAEHCALLPPPIFSISEVRPSAEPPTNCPCLNPAVLVATTTILTMVTLEVWLGRHSSDHQYQQSQFSSWRRLANKRRAKTERPDWLTQRPRERHNRRVVVTPHPPEGVILGFAVPVKPGKPRCDRHLSVGESNAVCRTRTTKPSPVNTPTRITLCRACNSPEPKCRAHQLCHHELESRHPD